MIQICDSLKSISGSLDLSSLAKISDGYSAGHIEKSVTTVLTDRRIQQVHKIVCVCVCVCVKFSCKTPNMIGNVIVCDDLLCI